LTALVVRYSGDVVNLQSAADSARRSAAARARANSRDAPVAGPALSRRHGPTARSQMGGDPEPRNDRSLGWLFLFVAAVTSFWVSDAFRYSLFGLMGGCLLGLLGLALSRWEETPQALHYTPNRWLILIITLAVTARLLYGVWRIWHGWHASGSDRSWLEGAGVAGSLALGASDIKARIEELQSGNVRKSILTDRAVQRLSGPGPGPAASRGQP
jgi:hypothetical protein